MALDLDTGLLRNVLVCTRLGSISWAAQSLGRTQPALSQHLRRLEDIVGEALLQRAANGVTLTTAGAAFLSYAERIPNHLYAFHPSGFRVPADFLTPDTSQQG